MNYVRAIDLNEQDYVIFYGNDTVTIGSVERIEATGIIFNVSTSHLHDYITGINKYRAIYHDHGTMRYVNASVVNFTFFILDESEILEYVLPNSI